jgi:hypothetical protein
MWLRGRGVQLIVYYQRDIPPQNHVITRQQRTGGEKDYNPSFPHADDLELYSRYTDRFAGTGM